MHLMSKITVLGATFCLVKSKYELGDFAEKITQGES